MRRDRDQPWISCSAVMEAGESYSRSIDIVIYNQTGSPIAVDYCGTTDPEQLVLCSVGFYPANHGGDGAYRCEAHFVQDSGLEVVQVQSRLTTSAQRLSFRQVSTATPATSTINSAKPNAILERQGSGDPGAHGSLD